MTKKEAPFRDEDLRFRFAKKGDAGELWAFGITIPELKVSDEGEFMTRKDVRLAVESELGVVALATLRDRIVGFCYANVADSDRPGAGEKACLVYLAVAPEMRGHGIAARLYGMTLEGLRELGVNYVYAWAHPTSGIIGFLERREFAKGHPYVWMDKKL